MKEIIVGPGDEIRDVFWKALQKKKAKAKLAELKEKGKIEF